jgi:4-aminobutyrate aminotransferase-like enzyme
MYEAFTVEGHTHPTIAAAVKELVEKLQGFGFRRMRTRTNFKGTKYLAEKETWVEYQDRP